MHAMSFQHKNHPCNELCVPHHSYQYQGAHILLDTDPVQQIICSYIVDLYFNVPHCSHQPVVASFLYLLQASLKAIDHAFLIFQVLHLLVSTLAEVCYFPLEVVIEAVISITTYMYIAT